MTKYTETQRKILEIGKEEFLAKGFKDASLRGIVKAAGFTQGAFYGYYPDKAALFDALVSEAADTLMEQFKAAQRAHYDLITEEKTAQSQELSTDYLNYFINYIYDNSMHSNWCSVVLKGLGTATMSMSLWNLKCPRRKSIISSSGNSARRKA